MQLRPARQVIGTAAIVRDRRSRRLIVRETTFSSLSDDANTQELYAAIGASQSRNDLLFDDILIALEEGRPPALVVH